MTSPYGLLSPPTPDDLSEFYPEWAAPAYGMEAERRHYQRLAADKVRSRRRQALKELVRRLRRARAALWPLRLDPLPQIRLRRR